MTPPTVFPVHPISAGKLTQDPNIRLYEPFNEIATNSYDPAGLGRRVTAPTLNMEPPRVLMRVRRIPFHNDYDTPLTSQRTYSYISTTSLPNLHFSEASSVGPLPSTSSIPLDHSSPVQMEVGHPIRVREPPRIPSKPSHVLLVSFLPHPTTP